MSIWSLLPAAISIGSQLINKPKKSDYTPNLDYLRRYISDLRGRQAGREVYHQAMQPALRTIGQQGRRMQRQIGYDVAKSGLGGSGIEAQQRLSAGRDVLSAMQEAGETATSAQLTESRRLGRQAENVQMQVGAEEERARQNYEQAKSQWQKNLVTTGANLAASGIDKYVAGLKTAKETAQGVNFAFKQAEAGGTLPEGVTTVEQYVQHAKGLGVTPDQLLKIGGIQTTAEDPISRAMTDDEIRERGFDPAPEGFQYKISHTGTVSLIGKTPKTGTPSGSPVIRELTQMNNVNALTVDYENWFVDNSETMTDKEFTQYQKQYAKAEQREEKAGKLTLKKEDAERSLQTTFSMLGKINSNPDQLTKVANLINQAAEGSDVTAELSDEIYTLFETGNVKGIVLNVGGTVTNIDLSKATVGQLTQLTSQYMGRINKAISSRAGFENTQRIPANLRPSNWD